MRHAHFVSTINDRANWKELFEAIAHFSPAALRLHACSTVDSDDFAIHPFAILRSEETDDAGDVDGLTHSSDWGPCFCVLFERKKEVSMLFSHTELFSQKKKKRRGEEKKKKN